MAMLRTLLCLLVCGLTTAFATAGDFIKLDKNIYKYTGIIDFNDIAVLKGITPTLPGEKITIYVDSYGGYLEAGFDLGRYTRTHNSNIHMVTREAYSAAALWVIGDKSYDYETSNSFLWFHLPYYSDMSDMPDGSAMELGFLTGLYIQEMVGTTKTTSLMHKMAHMRDTYGINGAVVWRKGGSEKYYNCYWDEKNVFIMEEVFPVFD